MSEKPPKLNKPYRQLNYHEKKINRMTKTQLIEYIFINPAEFDVDLMNLKHISERAAKKESKKDLMWLKEHLTMCPVALTIYETITQVRETLRPYGFNNLEAWAAVELAYQYMEQDHDDQNTYLIKRGITSRPPKTKDPKIPLNPTISEAIAKIKTPKHKGDMKYLNDVNVKGCIQKGIARIYENWLEAIDEAIYTTREAFDYGDNISGPSYPLLRFLELQYAPVNIRLMKKYDGYDDKGIEKWLKRAKDDPDGYIV